jgi:hypothetical protein
MNNKGKKMTHAQQRKAWIAKGLCGIDGKKPVWNPKLIIQTEFGKVTPGPKAECKEHFLYFKGKAFEVRADKAKPKKKVTAKIARAPGKETKIPNDMVDAISRQVAHNIGGGATVQLQPMTRSDLFNAIRTGVQTATRQIGFRPPSS